VRVCDLFLLCLADWAAGIAHVLVLVGWLVGGIIAMEMK